MKTATLVLLALTLNLYTSSAQINLKRKAEKKADQVIDDFLFGKKKKKQQANDTPSTPTTPDVSTGTSGGSEQNQNNDGYTPQDVDFNSLNLGESIHFNTLINMLPERTQGFTRQGKPEGARYTTGGSSFSTGSKTYQKGDREMTITLNDYLGAEYLASAQTAQQFEYESTDGYAKSVEIDGIPGWISYDYESKEGTLLLFKDNRFYATVQAYDTSEEELKAIAKDINLSRLKAQ